MPKHNKNGSTNGSYPMMKTRKKNGNGPVLTTESIRNKIRAKLAKQDPKNKPVGPPVQVSRNRRPMVLPNPRYPNRLKSRKQKEEDHARNKEQTDRFVRSMLKSFGKHALRGALPGPLKRLVPK